MSNIILNPEFESLVKEIEELKIQIATLIEERDQLFYHDCKLIKAEYMSKIGVLEYKIYEFQMKYLRLKRKLELYQVYINRQEIPDETQIETQLETEYQEYEQKIKDMYDDVQNSLASLTGKVLSKEDSAEVKKLYRILIKKLHPDLNHNYNDKTKELFFKVEYAYQNGDLKTLQNILLLIEDIDTNKDELEVGELEELKNKKKKLLVIIEDLYSAIDKIKNSFPYNQLNFIKNETQIIIKQKELNATLDDLKIAYKGLEDRLNKIKGEIK